MNGEIGIDSHRRNVAAFARVGGVACLNLAAKSAQDLVLAYSFGASAAVDMLGIAMGVVSVVVGVLVGPLVLSFIPAYISSLEVDGRVRATSVFGSLLPLLAGSLLCATIILELSAPLIVHLMTRNHFSGNEITLGVNILRLFLVLLPLRAGTQLLTALLNAERLFVVPVITAAMPPVVAIGFIIGLGPRLGVYALVLGTLLGEALQLGVLLSLTLARTGRIRIAWGEVTSTARIFTGQFLPAFGGAILICFNPMVDRAFAAGISAGSVARILYGEKLVGSGLQVVSLGISTVLLPYFSRLASTADWSSIRRAVLLYSTAIWCACVPIVSLIFLFSPEIVRLILQHGAFHAEDSAAVSSVVRALALQIPFYSAGILVGRAIAALGATHLLFGGSIICLAANVILDFVFVRYWGLTGIALGTSVVYALSFSYLLSTALLLIRRRSADCLVRVGAECPQ